MTSTISVKDNLDYYCSSVSTTDSENSDLDSSSVTNITLNTQAEDGEESDSFDDLAQKETEQRIRFLRKKFRRRKIHRHQIIRISRSNGTRRKSKSKVALTDDLLHSWLQHMSLHQHGAEESTPKKYTKTSPPQKIGQEVKNNKNVFRSTPMKFIKAMVSNSAAHAPSYDMLSIQRTEAFDLDDEIPCLQ